MNAEIMAKAKVTAYESAVASEKGKYDKLVTAEAAAKKTYDDAIKAKAQKEFDAYTAKVKTV